jgi:NAD(P)-dependent dehydrogenase (short-subunit alcohol dehydrogenase family)
MEGSADFLKDLFSLAGKVIIVSGSTSGLGYGMAKSLLQAGATVVINGRVDERVVAARDSIYLETGVTSGLWCCAADVSVQLEAKELVAKVVAEHGKVDAIINNAGNNLIERPFADSTIQDWECLCSVNLHGPINLTLAALPYLKQVPAGRIINLASIAGHVGMVGNAFYSMTKAAMLLFTKSLALELAGTSVTVNSISPGVFATPMNAKFAQGTTRHDDIVKQIPADRLGLPHELAGVVVYLCSGASSYTTGADFLVDGGYTAA